MKKEQWICLQWGWLLTQRQGCWLGSWTHRRMGSRTTQATPLDVFVFLFLFLLPWLARELPKRGRWGRCCAGRGRGWGRAWRGRRGGRGGDPRGGSTPRRWPGGDLSWSGLASRSLLSRWSLTVLILLRLALNCPTNTSRGRWGRRRRVWRGPRGEWCQRRRWACQHRFQQPSQRILFGPVHEYVEDEDSYWRQANLWQRMSRQRYWVLGCLPCLEMSAKQIWIMIISSTKSRIKP